MQRIGQRRSFFFDIYFLIIKKTADTVISGPSNMLEYDSTRRTKLTMIMSMHHTFSHSAQIGATSLRKVPYQPHTQTFGRTLITPSIFYVFNTSIKAVLGAERPCHRHVDPRSRGSHGKVWGLLVRHRLWAPPFTARLHRRPRPCRRTTFDRRVLWSSFIISPLLFLTKTIPTFSRFTAALSTPPFSQQTFGNRQTHF